jgi:[ribosomal protein S5]-alanine N-acetyltransferase
MEKMPLHIERTAGLAQAEHTSSDWRQGLPLLTSGRVTLRELRREDAATLFSMLSTEEVSRFISPPPTTVEGFARFIDWAIQERECGAYACFGVVPEGMTTAVGLFQLRSLEYGFGLAEWGFALGSAFWGSEVFERSANLVLEFAFDTVGVHRIEARASIANGRGNGALRKIGAVQEGVLRRSFLRNGVYHDQLLWSILAEDWHLQREETPRQIH